MTIQMYSPISILTCNCVKDGWNPDTRETPEGERDLRDYVELDPKVIPATDTVKFEIVGDNIKPICPAGYFENQQEYILGIIRQIKGILILFLDEKTTITPMSGFQITKEIA